LPGAKVDNLALANAGVEEEEAEAEVEEAEGVEEEEEESVAGSEVGTSDEDSFKVNLFDTALPCTRN
jgi:hypothetical protein